MNKIIKYIALSVLCIAATGCADFLDNAPDDELTLEMIFNDKTRTEDWLANIYSGIPEPYMGMLRDGASYEVSADDMTPSQRYIQWWSGSLLNWRIGAWFTNSGWNSNYWNKLPQKIRSAYILINNAHPIAKQEVSAKDIEYMKNECRFLIAYYYWLMTEAYGAVPFFDDIADVNAPQSDLMKGQRSFDETVDWIEEQLMDLVDNKKLPEKWEPSFFGRATTIAALAVREKMLLFAASPLVNGNPMYKGFLNHDEQERFNSTYDPQKWERAAQASKELIDAAHAAGHKLYYEYNDDGSIDPFMSCANLFMRKTSEGNNEILFARPDCNFSEYEHLATPRGASGGGGLGVTQSLVDAFFMENGLSPILGYNADGSPIINEASGYTESGFSTEPEIRNTKWNLLRGDKLEETPQPGQITLKNTFNMYSRREPRFYLTVTYNGQWYWADNRRTEFMSNQMDGGPTHDAPQNGYLVRKRVSIDQNNRNGIHPYRPGILFRLGESYLNYAEALNECSPGHQDILKYLNLIRERAGIPQYGSGEGMIPAPTTQDGMREIIRKERRVELCCEGTGTRYNDIRRWMLGEEFLDGDEYGMNFSGKVYSDQYDADDPNNPDKAPFFVRTVNITRSFEKKNYWFPIFQDEIDKDPTLVQAPFWME